MTDTNDSGPAFPTITAITNTGATKYIGGMSLRDWFAGQALTGLLINEDVNKPDDGSFYSIDDTARDAYRYADEMLKERNK